MAFTRGWARKVMRPRPAALPAGSADLAIAGGNVILRMAAALGQMVEPTRSPPQMIHVFAQALREPDQGLGDADS